MKLHIKFNLPARHSWFLTILYEFWFLEALNSKDQRSQFVDGVNFLIHFQQIRIKLVTEVL
jgi:hypothetical protein